MTSLSTRRPELLPARPANRSGSHPSGPPPLGLFAADVHSESAAPNPKPVGHFAFIHTMMSSSNPVGLGATVTLPRTIDDGVPWSSDPSPGWWPMATDGFAFVE